MKVNIDFSRRAKAVLRQSFKSTGSKEVWEYLKQFSSDEEFIESGVVAIRGMLLEICSDYGYKGVVDLRLGLRCKGGWYFSSDSRAMRAVIELNTRKMYNFLVAGERDSVAEFLEHEFRHHLDREFVEYSRPEGGFTLDENYFFDHLVESRVEGFADWAGETSLASLAEKSAQSRYTLEKVLRGAVEFMVAKRNHRNFQPEKYLDEGELLVCPYGQGRLLFDTLSLCRYGRDMSRQEQVNFLGEILPLTLLEFYGQYFIAAKQAGVSEASYVVPKERTLDLLGRMSSNK